VGLFAHLFRVIRRPGRCVCPFFATISCKGKKMSIVALARSHFQIFLLTKNIARHAKWSTRNTGEDSDHVIVIQDEFARETLLAFGFPSIIMKRLSRKYTFPFCYLLLSKSSHTSIWDMIMNAQDMMNKVEMPAHVAQHTALAELENPCPAFSRSHIPHWQTYNSSS
jgi:hypothetical protein